MDDIEERPSKIRKLDQPDVANSNATSNSVEVESVTEKHEASSPPPDEEEEEPAHDAAAPTLSGEAQQDTPQISKNQLKKLKKKQEWEAGREYRKTKRKEKEKAKKARKAAERALAAENPEDAAKIDPDIDDVVPPTKKRHTVEVPVTLILDCDFDDLMIEKEVTSLANQLTRCYSDNRNAPFRSNMVISSFNKTLKQRFENQLKRTHLGWKGVKFTEENFVEAAKKVQWFMESGQLGKPAGALLRPDAADDDILAGDKVGEADPTVEKEAITQLANGDEKPDAQASMPTQSYSETPTPKIVYLTSDSPNTLTHLSPNTSYIIGGIVDKNRYKGLCYKRAQEFGVETAKLPIGEFMLMQSRVVLTTNHVMEIMLKWLEHGDWGEAFLRVIPKRKEAKLRGKKGKKREGDADGDGDEEGEDWDGGADSDGSVHGDEVQKTEDVAESVT